MPVVAQTETTTAQSGAMDRILGTLLQRLDDPLDEMSKLSLILISTSNKPAMIDSAMQRRLGAKVARFKRLDRDGLAAVLSKKIKPDYPFASCNGTPQERLREQLIDEVVAALFSPVNEPSPLVELTLRDGQKIERYSRDFLTGALSNRHSQTPLINSSLTPKSPVVTMSVSMGESLPIACSGKSKPWLRTSLRSTPVITSTFPNTLTWPMCGEFRARGGRLSQLVATGA